MHEDVLFVTATVCAILYKLKTSKTEHDYETLVSQLLLVRF